MQTKQLAVVVATFFVMFTVMLIVLSKLFDDLALGVAPAMIFGVACANASYRAVRANT